MFILTHRSGFMGGGVREDFPVVEATNSGATIVPAANFAIPLPASIAAGDLLLVFACFSANNPFTLAGPAGFSTLWDVVPGSNHRRSAGYYKIATGSEGSVATASSSGGTPNWSTNSYRISNYTGTPECGTTATASSANANPPIVTASWGSAKNLFIAVATTLGQTNQPTANPTDYTDEVTAQSSGGNPGSNMRSCRRFLQAASDDPGTFTSPNTTWTANTVVIRGA